ncbi:hypothetical protein Cpir12675_000616 [Ceratocystis pirilliformis]|uniref:DUF1772-domain-containing protein n=1 Tax=Ceratocystis pirilliformis TaxID=259994 RepID=A0ABR3ZKJ5_9PEZI
MPASPLLNVAKGSIVLLAAAQASGNLMFSTFITPRLLDAPTDVMLKQWRNTFESGMRVFRPIFISTSLGFMGLAYALNGRMRSRMLVASGLLSIAVIPYTYIFMMPTNRELLAIAAQRLDEQGIQKAQEKDNQADYVSALEDRARRLVDDWGVLNLGRAALGMASAALGMAAILI